MKTIPCILLFRGRGITSSLIRWQTRGAYSHAAILMRDGRIVESWQGDGVRVKTLKDWKDIDCFEVPGLTSEDWDHVIGFCLDKVGEGYDYSGILRFISRRKTGTNESWFCSELVYAALRYVGINLFRDVSADEVSPGLLAISPLIKPIPKPDLQ